MTASRLVDRGGSRRQCRHPGAAAWRRVRTGRRTVNVAPRPAPSLAASIVPPCSSTSWRTIDRPSPRPPCCARARRVGLAEALEDVRQERRLDADAGVADDERVDAAASRASATSTLAAGGRELHRVRQQVPDHLLQAIGIADDGQRRSRPAVSSVELPAPRPPGASTRPPRATIGREVDGAQLEPQLAGDDARDVEQVFDQLRLRLRVALDDLERAIASLPGRQLRRRAAAASSRGWR